MPFAKVAELLNIPLSTLKKLRARGHGPPCIKIGRRLFVRPADLDAWIKQMTTNDKRATNGKA